jgi:hypothetical protein
MMRPARAVSCRLRFDDHFSFQRLNMTSVIAVVAHANRLCRLSLS